MTSRYWREWKRSKRETGAISSISDSPRAPIVICNDSGYVVLCFDASLHPRTDLLRPPQFDVGYELKQVLRRAIDREVQAQRLDDDDHVLFTMQHPAFLHAFQPFHVPVQEWCEQSQRVTLLLQKMAEKLNSNEQFHLDDRLRVQITTVRDPGQGSGRCKEVTPGKVPLMKFLEKKTWVIPI